MQSLTLWLFVTLGAVASEPAFGLSGTVVDADGKPVAGAMVVVAEGPPALGSVVRMAPVAAPKAPDLLAEGKSDESGRFTVSLPDEAPEVASRRTRLTVWAYHRDSSLAVRLIDRDWPRAGLSLTLILPTVDSVRFKITDANYRPAARARVLPLRVAGQLVPDVLAERLAADTDPDGRATLAGVVPAELDTVRVENQATGAQWSGLPAGRDKIVLISLAPVGRLRGRLAADDLRAVGRRRLRFVTWQVPSDEDAGGGLAEAVTDPDGNFDVPVLAAGSLMFEADRGPEPPKGQDAAPVFLSEQTTGPAVDVGETTTFEIPLHRAARVIQEVRDQEEGTPIAGVRVSMRGGRPGAMSGDSDASGRLRVDVPAGSIAPMPIRIPPPYYDPRGALIPVVEVGEGGAALRVVQLTKGVPVRARVTDDTGRPLAGAEITGYFTSPTSHRIAVHAWSNAHGEFIIDAVAPQTPVSLWARHGDATSVRPVSAQPAGEPVTLIVGKEPGISLEGRVIDNAGQPIAGTSVRVSASQQFAIGGRPSLSIDLGYLLFDGSDRLVTDAEGRFHTPPSLRPNATYSLEVAAPGMSPSGTQAIEPESWQTTRFADVVLHPAPRLRVVSGRVTDRDGRAVAGAAVWQSGDGPRRTRTTTDDEGRFQLGGIYEAPCILLVRKDGFRLQGARTAPAQKTCQIGLRRSDEPAAAMATLPPALSMDEQRELAMSLVEPLLPILRDLTLPVGHRELSRILARVDPKRGLELADTMADGSSAILARQTAAVSLVSTDFDEGLAAIARLDQPLLRVHEAVRACYELVDAPRQRRVRLLEEAMRQAQAETDIDSKVWELGRIGIGWLDLGDRERGVAALREGQALAEALPAADARRGQFGGMLARIDTPAALRLIEGFSELQVNTFRADAARGLADHDPAEAERLFRLIESPPIAFRMRLAPLSRMAAADPERAARLARTYGDLCERAFALGTVAYALAANDRAAASELLEEAYGLLDRAGQLGPTQYGSRDAALTAAALLPVAEKIDPALVEGYFWRAISLRQPWPALGDPAWNQDRHLTELAAMVARYDRAIARDLLWSSVGVSGRLTVSMMGLALADSRWAAELVQAMPDVSSPLAKSPKQVAARVLAEWLGFPQRTLWEMVYIRCNLRDPDTRDDMW